MHITFKYIEQAHFSQILVLNYTFFNLLSSEGSRP